MRLYKKIHKSNSDWKTNFFISFNLSETNIVCDSTILNSILANNNSKDLRYGMSCDGSKIWICPWGNQLEFMKKVQNNESLVFNKDILLKQQHFTKITCDILTNI